MQVYCTPSLGFHFNASHETLVKGEPQRNPSLDREAFRTHEPAHNSNGNPQIFISVSRMGDRWFVRQGNFTLL